MDRTVRSYYSHARIHQRIVEDFVVEIHHGLVITFFSKFSVDTVVMLFIPGTFHFLTEPGIFCCVKWYNHPLHCVHCIQIDRKPPLNGGLHQIRKEINKEQKSATEEKNNNNKNVRIDSKKGLKRVQLAI